MLKRCQLKRTPLDPVRRFSVPQVRYLSGTGNHTRAAIKGCEDYETISKAFGIGRTFKSFATPYLLKCQFILTLYTRTQTNGLMSIPAGGYEKSHVTPYMHCMVYHVPECIRRYGNLRTFSGQGVENHNDDAKRVYLSSNKWNARIDCL
ncbi:hypothetical protein EMCRGX_G026580 [Ephydatia muelleri]